jgi:hypothetical protein
MNFSTILLVIFGGLLALFLFFGYIQGLSKTFSPPPSAMDSSSIKTREQQSIDETREKEKQMMDAMKQKIRDGSRKY